jgi:hypothetical protein
LIEIGVDPFRMIYLAHTGQGIDPIRPPLPLGKGNEVHQATQSRSNEQTADAGRNGVVAGTVRPARTDLGGESLGASVTGGTVIEWG